LRHAYINRREREREREKERERERKKRESEREKERESALVKNFFVRLACYKLSARPILASLSAK
jgi:hypothetical protein